MSRHRPLITGLSAGALALGADYLAHAFANVPLAPEQAGYVLLKVLPLSAFADLLKFLGTLARPLLLMGATVVIIAAYGVAAAVLARLRPRWTVSALTALVALVATVVAIVALSPGDSALGILIEVVLLAGMVPLVDAVLTQLVSPIGANEDRRVLLRNLFYGAVGIALVGVGYANVRRFVTALATKEGNRADSEVTAVSDFYVVSKNLGGDPVVEPSSWRLNLPTGGLTYDQLLKLPSDELELTMECISNEVGGTLISNGIWKGPRVSDILALTAVPSDAVWMLMESADGYTESFALRDLTPDHRLVTHLNGAPLTPQHGFPARFIFPGHYGMKQPKWDRPARVLGKQWMGRAGDRQDHVAHRSTLRRRGAGRGGGGHARHCFRRRAPDQRRGCQLGWGARLARSRAAIGVLRLCLAVLGADADAARRTIPGQGPGQGRRGNLTTIHHGADAAERCRRLPHDHHHGRLAVSASSQGYVGQRITSGLYRKLAARRKPCEVTVIPPGRGICPRT